MPDRASTSPPLDPDQVLKLAAQSMFDTLARSAMGTLVVDREHRIVWISEGYKRFLPALGFDSEQAFVGRRAEWHAYLHDGAHGLPEALVRLKADLGVGEAAGIGGGRGGGAPVAPLVHRDLGDPLWWWGGGAFVVVQGW